MKYLGSGILVVALMLGLVGIAQAHHRRGATGATAGGCATCGTQSYAPVQSYGCQGGAVTAAPPLAMPQAPIYSGGCQGGAPVQAVYGGCQGGAPVQQSYGCAGGTAGRVGLFRHR